MEKRQEKKLLLKTFKFRKNIDIYFPIFFSFVILMEEPTDDQSPEIAPTEIPSKLTLNKNGKPRKQLGPEALEKLALARAKANSITKQNNIKKLEKKVEKMKVNNQDIAGNQMETPQDIQDIGGNEIEEPEVKVEKIKTKSKKKPQIIVEQSSDDEDEFEPNDKVIFVKRVTRKKKEKEPEVEPIPPPVMRQEPLPDIPKPKANPLQRQYDSMFSGSFLNQPRRRF